MAFAPLTSLPSGLLGVLREVGRHILRRPVVGIAMAARTRDGRWVLIRRTDTGTWALPGGTLEWGETLQHTMRRELLEEAGVVDATFVRVVGIYSRPDRDLRFHAVTIVVECLVEPPSQPPMNPMEIREVGLYTEAEVPRPLAMKMDDLFDAVLRSDATTLE